MAQMQQMTPTEEHRLMTTGMLMNDLKSSGFAVRRKSNLDIMVYLTSRSVTIIEVEEALLSVSYENCQFELECDGDRVTVRVIMELPDEQKN